MSRSAAMSTRSGRLRALLKSSAARASTSAGRPVGAAAPSRPMRSVARPGPRVRRCGAEARLLLTWRKAFEAFPEFRKTPRTPAETFEPALYEAKARALGCVLEALRAVPGSHKRRRDWERAVALLKVLIEGLQRLDPLPVKLIVRLQRAEQILANPLLVTQTTGHAALGLCARLIEGLTLRLRRLGRDDPTPTAR